MIKTRHNSAIYDYKFYNSYISHIKRSLLVDQVKASKLFFKKYKGEEGAQDVTSSDMEYDLRTILHSYNRHERRNVLRLSKLYNLNLRAIFYPNDYTQYSDDILAAPMERLDEIISSGRVRRTAIEYLHKGLWSLYHSEDLNDRNFFPVFINLITTNLTKLLNIYGNMYPLINSEEPWYKRPFSKIDITLKTKFNINKLIRPLYFSLTGKYSYTFEHYRNMIPQDYQVFFDTLVFYCLQYRISEKAICSALKDFGTELLRLVIEENYPTYLLYLVELHLLCGYDGPFNSEFNLTKEFEKWTAPRAPPVEMTLMIKDKLDKLLDNIEFLEKPNCIFGDWVRFRDNWYLPGTCSIGERMEIQTAGMHRPAKLSSKFANTMSLDDDQLLEILTCTNLNNKSENPYIMKGFRKLKELFKTRGVMAFDTRSYIRSSYLYSFIGDLNKYGRWTTLAQEPERLSNVHQELMRYFRLNKGIKEGSLPQDSGFWFLCTDQSGFDQHIYKEHFLLAERMLLDRIVARNTHTKEIAELEMQQMPSSRIELEGVLYDWQNGLPSGHKFTALIGSLLNAAISLAIMEKCGYSHVTAYFQGDDALIVTKDRPDKRRISQAYKEWDLVVNPMKSWVSQDRTEFLHQVYTNNGVVRALPCRATMPALYESPERSNPNPVTNFTELIKTYNRLARRGLCTYNYARSISLDFFSKYGITRNLALYWLHTPPILNGGGFYPICETKNWMQMNDTIVDGDRRPTIITTPVRYKPISKTNQWVLKRLKDYIHMPDLRHHVQLDYIFHKNSETKLVDIQPTRVGRIRFRNKMDYSDSLSDNSIRWRNRLLFEVNELKILSLYGDRDYTSTYTSYLSIRNFPNNTYTSINYDNFNFITYKDGKFRYLPKYLADAVLTGHLKEADARATLALKLISNHRRYAQGMFSSLLHPRYVLGYIKYHI